VKGGQVMNDPVFKIKTDQETDSFGRFIIEPLEQGYGQTLGNSLRRVLLTSLPGSAITSINIEGVKHQFSTLSGMKEDVAEFILNIKKIRLNVQGDEIVNLSLNKTGPGEVTAADIELPAGVEIVNPDLVLANLADKKAVLSMSLTAARGYGYVPVEEKHDGAVGTIPVDALYSPILRVNYRVEATRVGRMTNLDKLVIELWTDATIKPSVALQEAAKILVAYFQQVVNPREEMVSEDQTTQTTAISDETLRMRIEEFDIPTRIVNALAKGNIETVGQLMGTPKEDLMKVKNLGAKSLEVVLEKLREKGINISI
jgi:DNA-directed RNA polymerase subunit alpha